MEEFLWRIIYADGQRHMLIHHLYTATIADQYFCVYIRRDIYAPWTLIWHGAPYKDIDRLKKKIETKIRERKYEVLSHGIPRSNSSTDVEGKPDDSVSSEEICQDPPVASNKKSTRERPS